MKEYKSNKKGDVMKWREPIIVSLIFAGGVVLLAIFVNALITKSEENHKTCMATAYFKEGDAVSIKGFDRKMIVTSVYCEMGETYYRTMLDNGSKTLVKQSVLEDYRRTQ